MGTLLICGWLFCIGLFGYLLFETCTYYRGKGWEDHAKANKKQMYDPNVTYNPLTQRK